MTMLVYEPTFDVPAVPDNRPVEVSVFLFARGLRFGRRMAILHPQHSRLDYRAPVLPFLPARLSASV